MKKHTLTTKAFGAVLSLLFMGVSFGVASPAHAQATTPSQSYTCLTLAGNLTQGMSDMGSQGQVFQLQQFLNQAGDMSYAPTGYFGPLTYAAAVAFQSANGVPGTGYVGPLTRAAIQKVSCGSSMTDPSVSVSIDSVTPDSVAVGGVVTVTGRGFDTAADNMVFMAGGAVTNLSASAPLSDGEQVITFTMPSAIGPHCAVDVACPMYVRLITSGTYTLYVQDAAGTSNMVSIAVTGGQVIPQ